MIFVANRVTGCNVSQTNASADIAGVNFADLFTLVGVHLQQAADTFRLALAGDQHAIAGLQTGRSTRE